MIDERTDGTMAFTEFREWLETLHAQPRFGPGDRAGTANFIDAAARARGVASLTTGEPVSLARAVPPDPAIQLGAVLADDLQPLPCTVNAV